MITNLLKLLKNLRLWQLFTIHSLGVSKTKSVEIPVEAAQRRLNIDMIVSCEGLADLPCKLELPTSAWLQQTSSDMETFAELLLGGSLAFMQSKQIARDDVTQDTFESVIDTVVAGLRMAKVEVQTATASLYAEASDSSKLAFLVKLGVGGLTLEGRGEDKELLSEIIEDIVNILNSK